MIISIASRRASPGATTLTGLLAGWWAEPETTRLLLEADESGGILAARWQAAHGLTWQPGLIELATLTEPTLDGILATGQPVSEGLSVIAAPPMPGQVINALNAMGDEGPSRLAGLDGLRAFVDCGRLTQRSAAIDLARRSVLTMLVCRPDIEEIYGMLAGVVELRDAGCHVGLALVGEGRWSPDEIAERAEAPLLGVLPDDPKGAQLVSEVGLIRSRRLDRSALGRALDDFVASVQTYCSVRQRPVDHHAPGVSPVTMGAKTAKTAKTANIANTDVAGGSPEAATAGDVSSATASVSHSSAFEVGKWGSAPPFASQNGAGVEQ